MSGGLSQQFCVRWNSHLGSLGAAFPQLLAGQRFVDVTLACEGHQVHCHRLVLAACSSYFESLLGENPCKHPIIILPRDIKLWEIQALVDFMYKGEVNVSQAGLPDLLKCAEILQIRGLCGSDAALNLNQIPSTSLPSTTNSPNDNQTKSNISKPNVTSTPNKSSSNQANISQTSSNNNVSKNSTSKPNDSHTSAIQNALIDHSPKIEAASPTTVNQNATTSNSLSIDSPMISIPLPTSNASCLSMDDCDDSLNGSASEVYVDDSDMKLQEDYSNDGHSMVKLEPENKQPSPLFFGPQTDYQQESSKFGKIRVKSRDNLFENYNSNKNYHPSTSSATFNLVVNECDDSENFVNSPPSSSSESVLQRNLNVVENELLPPSLKFNKNSMTIFVKKTNDLNDSGIGGDTEIIGHPEADANNSSENLYENIVCSPNLLTLSFEDNKDMLDINSDQASTIFNTYLATGTPRRIEKKRMKVAAKDENIISRSTHIVPPLLKYDASASNKQLLKELKRQDEILAIENSLLSGGPPPESFVLRNPRGNQPRTYNTDALWAALMKVKSGESIYRASRIHNVPRKTLRNWMKRWDIKSAYPMPRQLKQAAEKRKAKSVCDINNEMLAKTVCEFKNEMLVSNNIL